MSLLEDKRGVMKPVIKQTASSSVWSNYEGLEDLDLKLPASERETILSEVGKILAGLNDDYLTVARDVDDDVKYYVSVTKDTPEGKQEYVVVEDTLQEAKEKEAKAIEKLEQVRAIPECDEKYIAKQIELTGKDAEDIVGEYLDNLGTYLLNEQPTTKKNSGEEA